MNAISFDRIRQRLGLPHALPVDPVWSAEPAFLGLLIDHCLSARPRHIVECSSGVSTLVLARCCQLNGRGTVYSLENGSKFATATDRHLAVFGLQEWARVLQAPLRDYRLGNQIFSWYELTPLPNQEIDLLVVDGPPGFLQPLSRYPVLPLLRDRLSPNCRLFLDDAARPDEQEIIARWRNELPELRHDYHPTERGCSELWLARV